MTDWKATDIVLFTDGSFAGGRAGAGWFARSAKSMAFGGRLVDTTVRDSTEAEIEALWLGLDAVLERFVGVRTILAVIDNDAVGPIVQGRRDTLHYGPASRAVRTLAEGVRLEFAWTKGHHGKRSGADYANAVVDRLAGLGRRGERIGGEAPFDGHWRRRIADIDNRLARVSSTVTLPEAARIIGVPVTQVGDMLRRGDLKLARDSSRILSETAFRARQAMLVAAAPGTPGP